MAIVNNKTIYYNKNMISYKPFWNILKEKGESTYTLINKHGVSSGTIDRLRQGKGINTTTLNDLCKILHCRVEDIIEYVEE